MIYQLDETTARANAGRHLLGLAAACAACGKPLRGEPRYVVRRWRTEAMPVAAFEYYCTGCREVAS